MKFSGFSLLLLLGLVACSLSANHVPTVTLTVTPQEGQAPFTTTAQAHARDTDGSPLTYIWRVGDVVIPSTSSTLNHTFDEPGNFALSVTVSNGASSARAEQLITVHSDTPVIVDEGNEGDDPREVPLEALLAGNFRVDTNQGLLVTFRAADQATDDTTFSWFLGDGTIISERGQAGATIRHRYADEGDYQVRLETQRDGLSASSEQVINVDNSTRPAGVPDIIILGFAGRCGGDNEPFLGCNAPRENRAYLANNPRPATLSRLQEHLAQQGYDVTYRSFVSRLSSEEPSIFAPPPPGYLEAEAYLQQVYEQWIRGQDNPPRLIVLGHSYGAVWMNLLLFNNPEITFDYAISLDDVCTLWWNDHGAAIGRYYDQQNRPRPHPLEQGVVCNNITLPDGSRQDLEDVIPNNVRVNLEVQASPTSTPHDDKLNVRPDGSRRNIFTITATQSHAGINGVHQGDGAAMRWVMSQIDALGFPSLQ